MSKYPVKYHSESKDEDIDIEDMHDSHLLNAYRKRRELFTEEEKLFDMLLAALWDEVQARNLDPAYPNGKPPEQEPSA